MKSVISKNEIIKPIFNPYSFDCIFMLNIMNYILHGYKFKSNISIPIFEIFIYSISGFWIVFRWRYDKRDKVRKELYNILRNLKEGKQLENDYLYLLNIWNFLARKYHIINTYEPIYRYNEFHTEWIILFVYNWSLTYLLNVEKYNQVPILFVDSFVYRTLIHLCIYTGANYNITQEDINNLRESSMDYDAHKSLPFNNKSIMSVYLKIVVLFNKINDEHNCHYK